MQQFKDNLCNLKKNSELIGRDKEAKEIIYRIASSNMLVIEGERGIGKTALLKYAINNFKGKGKVIYIDIGTFGKRFDISNLLNKKSKDMILLVDNVQYLSEENNKKIKYFYDQDYIKSVVFATTDYDFMNFTDSIRSRVGRNVIKLKNIKKIDVLKIVKKRLKDKDMFSKEILDVLYKNSKNIKDLLIDCNALCGYLKKNGKKKANMEDLKHIQKNKIEEDVETCLECGKKLVKVGSHWVCKNCDNFCKICGSLYEKEDVKCPVCGSKIKENKK